MTPQEMVDVIKAFNEGKEVQCRSRRSSINWLPADTPCWDFSTTDYRIKPEPVEFWVNIHKNGEQWLYPDEDQALDNSSEARKDGTFDRCVHLVESK